MNVIEHWIYLYRYDIMTILIFLIIWIVGLLIIYMLFRMIRKPLPIDTFELKGGKR